MSKFILGGLACCLIFVGMAPAHAETDLVGTWSGTFTGVSMGAPHFGPAAVTGRSAQITQPQQGEVIEPNPEFVETEISVIIETQKGGALAGHWASIDSGFPFVCTFADDSMLMCADNRGFTRVEVQSESQIKVCYVESSFEGKLTGCASLTKR